MKLNKKSLMKKLIVLSAFLVGLVFTQAQEAKPKQKDEVQKTATVPQTINNVVNPKHKKHNGYKIKKKTRRGKKYVKKVNTENHTATIKTKNSGEMDKNVKTVPTK